jgi:serine/threonine protein kinase
VILGGYALLAAAVVLAWVLSWRVAEARAVNRIRQRNIIDIFSFGVLPGLDRHYFVMELLDGPTLGELMDGSGRLPLGVVLPIVRDVADALDAVHGPIGSPGAFALSTYFH